MRGLQLERGGVAPDLLAALPHDRDELRRLLELGADVQDVGVLRSEPERDVLAAARGHDPHPAAAAAARRAVHVLDARVLPCERERRLAVVEHLRDDLEVLGQDRQPRVHVGNSKPYVLASSGLKPQPSPRMTRPPATASSVAAILAVSAGLRNVEFTTSKPMSGRGTGGRDRARQDEAVERDRARCRPTSTGRARRSRATRSRGARRARAISRIRLPCLRRLPAVELVEVALRQLEPDPDVGSAGATVGGHRQRPRPRRRACCQRGDCRQGPARLVRARAPAGARELDARLAGSPRRARTASRPSCASPGGVTTNSSQPCVGPLLDLLDPAAQLGHHLGIGERALVRAHHPLAVEVRHALVGDARIQAALQLDACPGRGPSARTSRGTARSISGSSGVSTPRLKMSAYFAASGNVTLGPRPATMILTRGRRTPRGALSRSWTVRELALERERRLVVVERAGDDLEVLASGSPAARRAPG